jgi:hypothetical protein
MEEPMLSETEQAEKMPKVRCAHTTREGHQCGNMLLPGQFVCHMHGGGKQGTALLDTPEAVVREQPPAMLAHPTTARLVDVLESLANYTPRQLAESLKVTGESERAREVLYQRLPFLTELRDLLDIG